ncbi:hypothetical protein [Rufibacter sp. XAAS-G3-1]|uniref:hypothetical protein n=1 Tax=Rufibacter sp. XAAS-G3-1 TaxID=2729134 RepID=UPI0015E6ADE8|nr:hypothetical protein [Rufibacter sp. XAAS-G3-1]
MRQEPENIEPIKNKESMENNAQAGMFAYKGTETSQGLIARLCEPTFSVREAGITAKRFHGWHHAGLLPFAIPEGRKNLLSFHGFIWVRLIDRLRTLGYPLENIRQVKEYLFAGTDPGDASRDVGHPMPLLETLLIQQLVDCSEVGVVLIPPLQPRLWVEASGETRLNGTHLYLSLTEQVRELRVNKVLEAKVRALGLPNPQVTDKEGMYGQQTVGEM